MSQPGDIRERPDSDLGKEVPEPDEKELAGKLVEALTGIIQQWHITGLHYRPVHVKGHLAVRAEFTVAPDLPPELRVGVLKEPRTFPAWIRFSNANHFPTPDKRGDVRGLAIKLMGVEGKKLLPSQQDATTQDFMFLSSDIFLTKTATDFYLFAKTGAMNFNRTLKDWVKIVWFMLGHPGVGIGLFVSSRRFPNLLEINWYSATPYLCGNVAVKYRLRPWQEPTSKIPDDPSNNFLRERLASDLRDHSAGFDFMIQIQRDARRQPIENVLVPWKESEAPFQTVATVTIPRQDVGSPEQRAFAENLSFNPWHCLPEHRPIGGVNRVRREVYNHISQFRHQQNGVPVQEPEAANESLLEKDAAGRTRG
jgi:hypothetical protein